VRAAGFLCHFWHKTRFLWHSDRGGSQLCEREELFNYVEALWHVVVSKIHLLSILSCYRARRGITPSFLGQYPFPLAFRQRRVSAVRARRTIQLCLSTMARRHLKYPSFVDFVVLSCGPRDFSAIFGTKPVSFGNPTEEGLSYASAETYSNMSKHNGTPSSQISIFGRFFCLIVRAMGYLRHFWHKTHFPWHSDR